MRFTFRRVMSIVTAFFCAAGTSQTWAALSASADAQAVHWSSLIVQAKLTSVGAAANLEAATRPSDGATQYRLYTFEIADVLDGPAKPGDRISIVRFVGGADDNSEGGTSLSAEQIGKSFVLMLRPETELAWSRGGTPADPRPAALHDKKALAIVFLSSAEDVGADGLSYLKTTIAETREAEAKFSAADAELQATTLANAADDTEAEQAEHTLTEMGPKAVDAIKAVAAKANDVGKSRLQKVIDSLSPPPLNGAAASAAPATSPSK